MSTPAFASTAGGKLFNAPAPRAPDACRNGFRMMATRGKTAVITGASGGIGAATARRLRTSMPNLETLILCARNMSKVEAVAAEIRASGVHVKCVPVELGSIESTMKCAKDIDHILAGQPLDLLLNNAGVMACPLEFTKDGLEQQFGVNHVAAAALTTMMLPNLRSSDDALVIFVSSSAVAFARSLSSPPLIESKTRDSISDPKSCTCPAFPESVGKHRTFFFS
jgi:NAD(P)-dependent dehydrogenase (short-subunit alcohol dehydrogenase family)